MAKSFSAVGIVPTYFSFLDSVGYAMGSGTSLANGAASGAGQIFGVKNIGIPVPPARTVVITGDNGQLGAIQLPGNTAPAGTLVAAVRNPTFINGSQGTITETIGNTDMDIGGIPCPNFQPFCLIASSPALDQTPGSVGNQGYETTIWYHLTQVPLDETAMADSAVHDFTHSILATLATVQPWGKALTTVLNGATRALYRKFFNTNPALLHSFKGDGTIVTVTLDQTPAGTDGNNVIVYQDGVLLVYGTGAGKYQVSGKVITFGTAPTAGAKIEVLYFYPFVCT